MSFEIKAKKKIKIIIINNKKKTKKHSNSRDRVKFYYTNLDKPSPLKVHLYSVAFI